MYHTVMLSNLVSQWKIRVEVVFSVESGLSLDFAAQGKSRADTQLNTDRV